MLVSHRKRFIYLKTRKTAGSSVADFFEPYCVPESEQPPPLTATRPALVSSAGIIGYHEPSPHVTTWWNHMPAPVVRERLGWIWDHYTKFCCVRNPFDKVFSFFWWRHRHLASEMPAHSQVKSEFKAWLLENDDLAKDRDMYTLEGEAPCLNYYIRYESLHSSLAELCQKLDVPYAPHSLSWRKGQFRPRGLPYATFYDRQGADRVIQAYDKEFDWFDYSRDHRDGQDVLY